MRIAKPHRTSKKNSLMDFYNKRNKVLIYRNTGGLGDILMHRMMFEDIKKINPEMEITFACLPYYIDAVKDHPFIDYVIDCSLVKQEDYGIVYNTTSACDRYEMEKAPFADKNRSDIWAEHCGIELTNHKMHIRLTEEELEYGKNWLKNKNKSGLNIMFSPVSAMASKNLMPHHITELVSYLRQKNCFVYSAHHRKNEQLEKLDVPVLYNQNIRQWMSIISAADYIITVDTATFHYAGGVGKPMTGIFTWADGKIYGKYYNFTLVQKHRDNKDWNCGPCYAWMNCPKTKHGLKPCLTELTTENIICGIEQMFNNCNLTA